VRAEEVIDHEPQAGSFAFDFLYGDDIHPLDDLCNAGERMPVSLG
jgi:hypothetical protein